MTSVNQDEMKQKVSEAAKAFEGLQLLLHDEDDSAEVDLCLLIHENNVAWMIGKAGTNINDIKVVAGVHASFAKKEGSSLGYRRCIISGTVAAVTKAVFIMTSLVYHVTNTVSAGILIRNDAAGRVVGKSGANLKFIREQTSCVVTMEKQEDPLGGRCLHLSHPDSPSRLTQAVYGTIRTKGFASFTDKRGSAMGAAPMDAGDLMGSFARSYGLVDPTVCVIHNKKRGRQNLQPSATVPGGFECLANDQCKGASARPPAQPDFAAAAAMFQDPNFAAGVADWGAPLTGMSNLLMPSYGAVPTARSTGARFNPYSRPSDPLVCVLHKKKRGSQNLQPSTTHPGSYECLPNDRCKGASFTVSDEADAPQPTGPNIFTAQANMLCAIHGKKRGMRNLQPHDTLHGVYVCLPNDPCKTGGDK